MKGDTMKLAEPIFATQIQSVFVLQYLEPGLLIKDVHQWDEGDFYEAVVPEYAEPGMVTYLASSGGTHWYRYRSFTNPKTTEE